MRARGLLAIVLVVLLGASALAGLSNLAAERAHPAGTSFGVVTISANGTISNPSAPIDQSGNTYTLTGELDGSLVVLASNVVIDGAGHVVNYTVGEAGGDNCAVSVNRTTGVVLENLRVANASRGLDVNASTKVQVIDNVLTTALNSTQQGGIWVSNSTGVQITGNYANNSVSVSVTAWNSSDVLVDDNTLNSGYGQTRSTTGFYAYEVHGLWVANNTALGSLDAFYGDYVENGVFTHDNASFGPGRGDGIGIDDSSNVQVVDSTAFENGFGLWAEYSQNITFANNSAPYNYDPIYDYYDSQFTARDNYVPWGSWNSTNGEGLYSYFSANSLFQGNNVSHSLGYGANVQEDTNVQLVDNNLTNAGTDGVYLYSDYGSALVAGNDVSNSSASIRTGIYCYYNYGNVTVAQNQAVNLLYGVYVQYDYATTTISGNTFAGSVEYGVYSTDNYGDLTVLGNTFLTVYAAVQDGYSYGGWLTVSGNRIANYTTYGIDDWDYYYGAVGATITNNVVANDSSGYAIYLYETQGPTVVSGNDLAGNYYGVYAYDTTSGPLTITNNNLTGSLGGGVYAYSVGSGGVHDTVSVSPMTVTGNDFHGSYYGLFDEYSYGGLTFTDNAVQDVAYGLYLYDSYGPAAVSANNFDHSSVGVQFDSNYGGNVTVTGNSVDYANVAAIELEYDYSNDIITGNTARQSNGTAIYEYDNELGGSVIANNNATGSHEALNVSSYSYSPTSIEGNDLSRSGDVNVSSAYVTVFAGNNLLGDRWVNFTADSLGWIYHNDFPSSAFQQFGNTLVSTGWNATYPVGGNYWTGYSGTDAYSGPAQNVPGADGIGDTSYVLGGATDYYPLMGPWTSPTVTFVETGLPSGSTWSITFNGVLETTTAGQSLVFSQIDGAYAPFHYSVARSTTAYAPSAASGSGTLNGRSQTITVTFTAVRYSVTFSWSEPTGLGNWSATLGGTTASSASGTLVLSVTNGTYAWSVTLPAGYTASPATGSITVAGANATVVLNVKAPTVTISFILVGGPSSAPWSVSLNGGAPQTGTGSTITFTVIAGTYTFHVTAPSGYSVSPASGSVVVVGGTSTVYVAAVSASSPAPAGTTNVSNTTIYSLIGLVIVAALLALIGWVLFLRRRKGDGPAATPPPAYAVAPPPAAGNAPPPSPPMSG
jgi:parallel beta-helix repeat protein